MPTRYVLRLCLCVGTCAMLLPSVQLHCRCLAVWQGTYTTSPVCTCVAVPLQVVAPVKHVEVGAHQLVVKAGGVVNKVGVKLSAQDGKLSLSQIS